MTCEDIAYIVRQLLPPHCHNSVSYLARIIIGLHYGVALFINFAFDDFWQTAL